MYVFHACLMWDWLNQLSTAAGSGWNHFVFLPWTPDSMRVYPAAMCTIPPCQLGSWKFMKYVIRWHDPDFIIFHRPLIEFGGIRLFHAFSRCFFSIPHFDYQNSDGFLVFSKRPGCPGLSHATELLREAHASGAGRNPALKPWGRCFVNGSMLISLLRKFEFCVAWMVSWCFMLFFSVGIWWLFGYCFTLPGGRGPIPIGGFKQVVCLF